jgi:hypothetical protein
MVTQRYKLQISTGAEKIAYESSSKLVFFENGSSQKLFFVGIYTSDLKFMLFNISDFNRFGHDEIPVALIGTANLQSGSEGYKGCYGLHYREPLIFYTVCAEYDDTIYVVNVETIGLSKV